MVNCNLSSLYKSKLYFICYLTLGQRLSPRTVKVNMWRKISEISTGGINIPYPDTPQYIPFKKLSTLIPWQMKFVFLDVVRSIPQISASGYFNISKRLFPQVNFHKTASVFYGNFSNHFFLFRQLIGTTLTYFFILCQFQASEKNL